jgi:hypothetical protein
MNLGNKLAKLLTNKYFLYFMVFLSTINIFGYMVLHKLDAIILFSLIGLISYQFSKNMTVVLLISLIITNLFMVNKSTREGLENQSETKDTKTKPNSNSNSNSNSETSNKPKIPVDVNNLGLNSSITTPSDDAPEPFENSNTNKKNTKNGSSSRIDYASTLESAYDNLDKVLGSEGIQNLTKDTQTLMAKQQELFQTMQSMTPMLQQAKDMIKGFDMKSLEGLSGLASSFTSSGLAESK